jgi:hypothetical protein
MKRHAAELAARYAMFPGDGLPVARASLWLRDAAGLRETLGEPRASIGRSTDLRILTLRAGLAALEGRLDEARDGYLAAQAGFRDLGLRFEVGLAALEHAVFLPDDPSAAAAADEARAIFDLGATAGSCEPARQERVARLTDCSTAADHAPTGPTVPTPSDIGPWPGAACRSACRHV